MPEKCGFQLNHNISIWTSPNLTSGSWTYAGNAINVADRPSGLMICISYLYNDLLHHQVLSFVLTLSIIQTRNCMYLCGTI
jgi:hypothetical protein